MGGFNAAKAVSALDYNFRPVLSASGTIPEPSDDQVYVFVSGLNQIGRDPDSEDEDDNTDPVFGFDRAIRRLEELTKEQFDAAQEQFADAVAAVCSKEVTREQFLELPWRHRLAFLGWLVGELGDPTAATPGTRR